MCHLIGTGQTSGHLCVLVERCTEAAYLIKALCLKHKLNLIRVGANPKVLGAWAGLCKIDKVGSPRKVVK
ncbi:hypothetical protein EDC04DRAFT_2810586 [Pisolithus marmoratus]|nr:hypothetical protein EDC04DRAFT_2810586 [Pisolithus marmoratus]